jgi:hypothetical protein
MSQMKHRAGFGSGGSRLSDQGKSLKTGSGGGQSKFPDGVFDRFTPGEKAIWININPFQEWTFDAYNSESGEVETQTKSWYPYVKHYYARTKQVMQCSAGPHRDQPCYPCAIRKAFYKKMDAIEERTGVRPKDEAPISGQKNFGLAVTIMENVVSVPATDKNGVPRKSKAGKPIYNYVPQPMIPGPTNHPVSFGRRAHWSLGIMQLRQLFQFDEEMRNYCANCASAMTASRVACADCETTYDLPEPVSGEDLVEVRQREFSCGTCKYEGVMVPLLECSCGKPKEGKLTSFDIRIKKEKLADNQSMLSIKSIRLPKLDNEEIRKLVENPLDLPKIFAPSTQEEQRRKLGDAVNGIDPRKHRKDDNEGGKPDAESYTSGDESEGESDGDDDEIAF